MLLNNLEIHLGEKFPNKQGFSFIMLNIFLLNISQFLFDIITSLWKYCLY